MSDIVERTDRIDEFGYRGAYTFYSGKRDAVSPSTWSFPYWYDQSGMRYSRSTQSLMPLLVNPVKGIKMSIAEVGEQTLRARMEWDSPCSTELIFHRTPVIRGPLQIVH